MIKNQLSTGAIIASLATLLLASVTVPVDAQGAPSVTIAGTVRDNLARPVPAAQVTIAGVSVRTARDGGFRLPARGEGPYIIVIQHPDFAFYSRVLSYSADVGTFTLTRASRIVADPTRRIVLHDERRPEDCVAILSVSGSGPPCGPGFAVDIPANALVDAAGNRPRGQVEVKLATFEVHTESMPAPFVIAASDRDPTDVAIMTPYGAGSVEVHDLATGRALNLAPGRHARIDIPLHRVARQRTGAEAAPAAIPLLRFNRSMLRWVQVGTMPLGGSTYSAEVDHFTDFNADTGSPTWGCLYIQFWGSPPSQITNIPKAVRVELTPSSGGAIVFNTVEKGFNIIVLGHTAYTLPPNKYYFGRAFNGSTLLTDVNALPSPNVYVFPQNPQHPTLPSNPAGTCTHMDLYWDASLGKAHPGSWGDFDYIAGRVSFDRTVDIVRSMEDRVVIGRVIRGSSVTVIGMLRRQPWLLVLTPRGEMGLVPREGADLSRTRRPQQPPPGPRSDSLPD